MADTDLEEIRKARLAQLQQQQGSGGSSSSGGDVEGRKQQEVTCVPTQFAAAEARQTILAQILTPEAADRLGRIRLVKESRAMDIENRLIMLARSGQLQAKITEDQLKQLLGAVAENSRDSEGAGNIVISRRKGDWDDDDLDDL